MEMNMTIENMTCGGCVRSVTRAIQQVDAAASVVADVPSRRVTVTTTKSEASIRDALVQAGFSPRQT